MMKILEKMSSASGHVSLYYCSLEDGCELVHNENEPLLAASVIKIPIMVEAFRRFEEGSLSPEAVHVLKEEEKMPSCGALNRMHAGLEVSMMDLVELMIVLSDNTATNILIDILGIENVNAAMRAEGLTQSTLRRKLFDAEASRRGLVNHITAREIGMLLEKMYAGEIVSPEASRRMLSIMCDQRYIFLSVNSPCYCIVHFFLPPLRIFIHEPLPP